MNDLLSLTKIGNIKLGKVVNGNPLALEKMIVTRATKENAENFQPYPGFDKEGLERLTVKLPFNSIGLNFEVNYITFMEVDKVEYIAKAADIDKDILLYPLNPEDFNRKTINFGKLTKKLIEEYEFKYTGFLKVMIPEISNFGEVFYFKTGSINTIRALTDQLTITKTLLGGRLANYPLEIKPVKKDLADGTQIVFLSIGINEKTIYDYIENRKSLDDTLDFDELDKIYFESRKEEDEDITELNKKSKVVLLKSNAKEVVDIENKEEKLNGILEEEEITDKAERELLLKYSDKMQLVILIRYLKFLKGSNEDYLTIFSEKVEGGIKPYEILRETD